jgi:hypothetical protein
VADARAVQCQRFSGVGASGPGVRRHALARHINATALLDLEVAALVDPIAHEHGGPLPCGPPQRGDERRSTRSEALCPLDGGVHRPHVEVDGFHDPASIDAGWGDVKVGNDFLAAFA